jgi:hypothetical protein
MVSSFLFYIAGFGTREAQIIRMIYFRIPGIFLWVSILGNFLAGAISLQE